MSDVPPRLGKYEIIRVLGTGAMGVVYEAVDRVIDRRVAIKTIRNADLDEDEAAEQLRRFRIEARAAGKLNHPHIVSLYDHGEEAGITYLVMELVEGREMQRYFDEGSSFPLGDTVRMMGELLDALGFSHRQGVVHRDVKPDNIFITHAGAVKLGDFGIARIESTQKTRAGLALGTPSHMAPEQIRGEAADGRSDLYAAGVILFQLLTGQRPFSGTMLSMALKVLNEPAPKPSSINPQVTPQLDGIVARALAKKAEDRFQTAAEFWLALAEATGLAPPAPPPRPEGGDTDINTRSRFPTSAFSTSSFTRPVFGSSGLPTDVGAIAAAQTVQRTTPAPSARLGLPLRTIAALVAFGLIALALWAALRRPEPDPAGPPVIPSTTQPNPAAPSPAARADKPGVPPLQSERAGAAEAESPTAQTRPLEPSHGKPEALPPDPAAPTTSNLPTPKSEPAAGNGRSSASAEPPTAPLRPAPTPGQSRAQARRNQPAPAAIDTPSAIATPPPRPARPEQCSDILLKASLEPLTVEESRFLRRECQ